MFIRKIILLLVISILLIPAVSALGTKDKKETTRPKVGLVMSGGGAKGFACGAFKSVGGGKYAH